MNIKGLSRRRAMFEIGEIPARSSWTRLGKDYAKYTTGFILISTILAIALCTPS